MSGCRRRSEGRRGAAPESSRRRGAHSSVPGEVRLAARTLISPRLAINNHPKQLARPSPGRRHCRTLEPPPGEAAEALRPGSGSGFWENSDPRIRHRLEWRNITWNRTSFGPAGSNGPKLFWAQSGPGCIKAVLESAELFHFLKGVIYNNICFWVRMNFFSSK